MADEEREAVEEQLSALGYIDPGGGSSLWQIILAKLFGITSRVKRMFGKEGSNDE